MDWMVRWLDSW